jgi:hypothetical protein
VTSSALVYRAVRLRFVTARIAAASVRPVLLTLVARLAGEELANQFALIIISGSVGMTVSAFDSGSIYVRGAPPPSAARTLRMIGFARRWLLLAVIGAMASVIAAVALGLGWPQCVAVTVLFFTERAAEDRQRHLLFDNEVDRWSALQLRRASIQIAAMAGIAASDFTLAQPAQLVAVGCTAALILGNLSAVNYSVVYRWTTRLVASKALQREFSSGMWAGLWVHRSIAMTGLAGSLITLCDRFSIGLLAPADSAVLLTAQSAVNIQQVVWQFLEFTPRRHEIIQGGCSRATFATARSVIHFALCFSFSLLALTAVALTLPEAFRQELSAIALMLVGGTVSTLSMIPREAAFFGPSYRRLFRTEASSAIGLSSALLICKLNCLSISIYLIVVSAVKLLRLRELLKS